MIVFVSGGTKCGKSILSQCIAKELCKNNKLFYIATMISTGKEDDKRILYHINDREGWGFTTIEEGYDLTNTFNLIDKEGTVMLDSITALLSNKMFNNNKIYLNCHKEIINQLVLLSQKVKNLIIVSDDLFFDTCNYSDTVIEYMKELGKIHIETAKLSDIVIESINSNYIIRKGMSTKDIKNAFSYAYSLNEHLNYGEIE